MAKSNIHLHGILPGSHALYTTLKDLQLDGHYLTAFSEAKLKMVRDTYSADQDVEFVPFGELVGKISNFLGLSTLKLPTLSQLHAAINIVCQDLPEDSFFYHTRLFPGLHRSIAKTLTELHQWGYFLDPLNNENPKLNSLSSIEQELRKIFSANGIEFLSDRISSCIQHKPTHSLPIQKLFVVGGPEEYPLFINWLEWLACTGVEVHLFLENIPDHPELFQKPFQAISKVKNNPWYTSLFRQNQSYQAAPEVWKLSAPDPLTECEWILRDCLKTIHNGTWPHKIGIFLRDSENYASLLRASAKRLGVPISLSIKIPLLTNGFVVFTLRLLQTLSSSDIRELVHLSSNNYIQTASEKNDILVQQVLQSYCQGPDAWLHLYQWSSGHQEEYPWLFRALEWRALSLEEPTTLSQWHERLQSLINGTFEDEMIMDDTSLTKERDLRAQTAMLRSIADHTIFHETKDHRKIFTLQEFVVLCTQIWKQEDIVFPDTPSGVHVSTSPEAIGPVEHLYILGMLEGVIPKRRIEDPLINDADRISLSRSHPELLPLHTSHTIAQSERDFFIRLCASTKQKLVFSYPQTDENRDNVPAFYLTEIERLLKDELIMIDYQRKMLTPQKNECISPADKQLYRALHGNPYIYPKAKLETEQAKQVIQTDLKQALTPEELALVTLCPFQAKFKYQLKLLPSIKKNLWSKLQSIPQKALLSTQESKEEAKISLENSIDVLLTELYPSLNPWELTILKSGAKRLLSGWIEREFLARKHWQKNDTSHRTHVHLSDQELRDEIPVNGKKIKLKGKVDGLTTRGDYSVMHFYNSSLPSSNFSFDDPEWFAKSLYMLTQYGRKPGLALEIDAMTGTRLLALLPRFLNTHLPSQRQQGLQVKEIEIEPSDFFRQLKDKLKLATTLLESASIEPKAGQHCKHCSYGELCRSSLEFSEVNPTFE